jgi:hypothetical protein
VIVGVGNVEVRSIVSHYARDALFSPQNPEASFAARERTKNGTPGLTHMLRPGAIRPLDGGQAMLTAKELWLRPRIAWN